MRLIREKACSLLALTFLFLSSSAVVSAQAPLQPIPPATESRDNQLRDRLLQNIDAHQNLMRDLEELCDDIGARLTGSESLRRAQQWASAKLRAYGADAVWEEDYILGSTWHRGRSQARLLNANRQIMAMAQAGWTSSSSKPIQAEVAILDASNLDELRHQLPQLKGKIVLLLRTPKLSSVAGAVSEAQRNDFSREYNAVLKQADFAAVLYVSARSGNLLDMHGGPKARFKHNVGIIGQQDAQLLQRLIKRGISPRLELQFGGGFDGKPGSPVVREKNLIAEIRGTEFPDEYVVLGVHLDSWDLASGATDNGVGVALVMEVLRSIGAMRAIGTIRASQIPMKRSLRVILFSGEEQGLLGSKAYVEGHQSELGKVQAMLTIDSGAGRIIGIPDMQVDGWYDALNTMTNAHPLLQKLEVVYAVSKGSDHESFFAQGVPAFSLAQEPLDYLSHTWHSEADTLDHVKKDDLVYNAKVLSLISQYLLNSPRLPHRVDRKN
ncbi:M28 family peptidase [Undibacterium cyanobacteriorum]|uniref:Carboxypeptidase Q n=1 Tax=Undibacterium cyanobacteriorum TaxID=3073561 RepID=A0ABY9RMH1_9BURK|nr:M28 family peptidase [Undibacterium sp. 20NA77.5]WMW81885.1 M28 family peptidase [Undibacterium sp. 20NA77.5]